MDTRIMGKKREKIVKMTIENKIITFQRRKRKKCININHRDK